MRRFFPLLCLITLAWFPTGVWAQPAEPAAVAKEVEPVSPQPWRSLVTDGLRDAQGNRVEVESLGGKIVGLYFSAHWCPPCKVFSPKLVEFRNAHQKDFEVVFISSDHSEGEQFDYMKEVGMPWLVVPYKSKAALDIKANYGIRSIPTLVVCSPKGKVITPMGRRGMEKAPEACLTEWQKRAVELDR
jgi:nucleoredoxin